MHGVSRGTYSRDGRAFADMANTSAAPSNRDASSIRRSGKHLGCKPEDYVVTSPWDFARHRISISRSRFSDPKWMIYKTRQMAGGIMGLRFRMIVLECSVLYLDY